MAEQSINSAAWDLRSELYSLVKKFKDLQHRAWTTTGDAAFEASQQLDSAACKLAQIYEGLGDVFVDAARDKAGQLYAI